MDIELEQKVQELKGKVKAMLMVPALDNPSQKFDLIDQIQRLGVSYHFEDEISTLLQQINKNGSAWDELQTDSGNLYTAALYFRLLRQQGYSVPCGKLVALSFYMYKLAFNFV